MKNSLHQKQTIDVKMTADLTQAIKLLHYSTPELYEYIIEQAAENPFIDLEEREIPQSIRTAGLTSADLITPETGMRENLIQQARITFENAKDRQLVLAVIDNLDEDGYLIADIQMDASAAEQGIHLLQQIGPAGIGARDLKECLSLQLAYGHPEEKLARVLVENHLEHIALRKLEHIAAAQDASMEEVQKAADLIKTLNPRPAAGIAHFQAHYVTPDVIVEINDSRISFYLNDRYLPSIRLNPEYLSLAQRDSETASFIKEKHRHYEWLVKSIEQRRSTIVKIMNVIIEKQTAFFQEGFLALKPLTLKDVATEIGMHESTISRATANKVIQMPNGTFSLRQLFSSKLSTVNGDSVSQRTLQMLLKNLIDAENKHKPLSDQKIADFLKNEKGVHIARRTIAKYREQLKIPAAYKRKI